MFLKDALLALLAVPGCRKMTPEVPHAGDGKFLLCVRSPLFHSREQVITQGAGDEKSLANLVEGRLEGL